VKARIFWVCLAVVILGFIGWRVALYREKQAAPPQQASEVAVVRSARAVRVDLDDKVAFTGTIRPANEVDVFSKAAGRVEVMLVQVGDRVRAGQVICVVEHKEVGWQAKAAEATVMVAKANLDGARLNHDRTQALYQGGSATQAQVDGAKVGLALAQAQLAQAEASAGLAEQMNANATTVAPIAGTVVRRPVNVGANVGPATPIATIQDVATLKLEASVDAPAFARLKKGEAAAVIVDTLPDEIFPGKVSVLSPSLDATTRRAAIEIAVDNSSGRLMPNMFARAEVVAGELRGQVAVPRAALFEAGGGAVVFRLKGGKAEMVRPRLGPTDGERVAVLDGVSEGDELAVTGQASLADGSLVKVAESPAAKKSHQN
jgi:RND family efflux transporter MFP subunit